MVNIFRKKIGQYSDKAKSATIFKRWRDVVTNDPKYISMRKNCEN